MDLGDGTDGTAVIFKDDIVHAIMDTPVASTHGDMLIWDDGVTSPTTGTAAWVNSPAVISVNKDFDAVDGDTDFDLLDITITSVVVHINGALQRDTEYALNLGVVSLGTPSSAGDWVNIVGTSA